MHRLAIDEDVHEDIVAGLGARLPALDLVYIRDTPVKSTPDEQVLEWAAAEGRVLVTGDVNTMVGCAWDRVKRHASMPGVLAIKPETAIGPAVEDLCVAAECFDPGGRDSPVLHIPFS